MARTAEVTLTEFLRDPNAVVERLEHTDVVLHRRNAEDLRLSLASRSDTDDESIRLLARILGGAVTDDLIRERLAHNAASIPWVSFLPINEREQFITEFLQTAEAAGELGEMAPLAQLLIEWKATAAIYADPALAAELRRPLHGRGGAVPAPNSG